RIISIEALARIKNQEGEYISPNIFINIAEKSGLISKLSELVLGNVCHFLKRVDIKSFHINRVSINLSGIQFLQTDFIASLVSILKETNVSINLIGLEIIESVATSSIININEIMNELIDLGFSFYLDDYGKGYSNIDSISSLPFEYIKIDKSIIENYDTNKTVRLFLNSLVEILNESNKKIVVEGVESLEHIQILKILGVDYVQGFYYSEPLSEQEMIDLIKQKALKF
ncbi:MAG: EAL domain-containing protein, partial [Bacilli bacterium]|nr:EAL domain-containing protein [Bacilli bacterium]